MNKISFKVGMLVFISIFVIDAVLFIFLHNGLILSRVDEELMSLKARGNNHRDVLEKSFKKETLQHIVLMESQSDTDVVITDQHGKVIASSDTIDDEIKQELSKKILSPPRDGMVLEDNWKEERYLSTVSPFFINKKNNGYVYMFKRTDKVQDLISRLNEHFLLAGILTIIFMLITILILSKVLTTPLIKMKEATKKLSRGDFSVTLPRLGNDELGELALAIQLLAKDLSYLKQERNEFLASISHELRTPLTYIKGYADISRRKNISEEERETYLNIIFEEADRVSLLVKDLFDLAKFDQNSFTIMKEKINLSEMLQAIYQKISPAFMNSNVQLEMHCSSKIFINADPVRFEQVLYNLLDNALKYSEADTKTTVEVKKMNQNIHIYIKDQGKGIPKEDLPYIFDRFYRVDKSRSRALGGTGLGLAIVKEIIEAHGGTISVESSLNKGTCFEIILKEHKE